MNKVILLLALLGLTNASPVEQTVIFNEDGSYRFNFDTGKDAGSIARHEERQADGTVIGRYSYEDPTGSVRVVNYRAGRQGFVATGDVGVAGAPPSQVPLEIPPVPPVDQPIQEEPGQELVPVAVPEKPVEADKPAEPEVDAQPDQPEPPTSAEEPTQDTNPEEPGRKREAGSPPAFFSDNGYPFAAPVFGKRRLDIPDEEKPADEEADKVAEPVKPPTTNVYRYHISKPFTNVAKPQAPVQVEAQKPHTVPQVNPIQYYYYVPVSPGYANFFPGSQVSHQSAAQPGSQVPHQPVTHFVSQIPQQHFGAQIPQHQPVAQFGAQIPQQPAVQYGSQISAQQPVVQFGAQIPQQPAAQFANQISAHQPVAHFGAPIPQQPVVQYGNQIPARQPVTQFGAQIPHQPSVQAQFHSGPPKAWAYVPLSAFPQQHSVPSQPSAHPHTWAYIQPHAVSYIPSGTNDINPAGQPETVPSSGVPDDQMLTVAIQSDPNKPTAPVEPSAPEQATPEVQSPPEGSTADVPEPVKVEEVPAQRGFQRPTVHHYHFRGPSHTYGYYYQY